MFSPALYKSLTILLISVGAFAYYVKRKGDDEDKYLAGEADDPFLYPDQGNFNAIIQIGDVVVTADSGVVSYVAKMATDYDGAPKAYGPPGTTPLDNIANAGKPGKWWGISTKDGEPIIQGDGQPAPGYYISTTSLRKKGPYDGQWKYIDASTVPYVAIPKALFDLGVRLGNLAKVSSGASVTWAVVADVGPAGKIGEGSSRLKDILPRPDDGLYVYKIYTGIIIESPYGEIEIQKASRKVST